MAEEEFKKYVQENNMTEYIKHSMRERKAYDMLIENGTIKKGEKINFLTFISLNN
jgi:FKBP-type peptidyl-prolyl cis-trans isomerase (trigger factor)